ELNRPVLKNLGVPLLQLDIRSATGVGTVPAADFVIHAAANPSVLAGVGGPANSREVMEHNLLGTINLLEYCKEHHAGFVLLSSSRVYSMAALRALPLEVVNRAFRPVANNNIPGVSGLGVREEFSTAPPLSLYGSAKLASEQLALEYGAAFDFPVWINRCGVLAGAGQFGKADQGIFSFWIHSYRARRPLRYTSFGGEGYQVRDCLHPRDLVTVLRKQLEGGNGKRVCNFSGGAASAMSLRQLTDWCASRFGPHAIERGQEERPFDIGWLVVDSSQAEKQWDWRPQTSLEQILEEIAAHAEAHPEWLDLSR
ncbi:MAG: NAD-dependent epimerase/dehydratase family protein, partial [Chthoniobacterales bacterium]